MFSSPIYSETDMVFITNRIVFNQYTNTPVDKFFLAQKRKYLAQRATFPVKLAHGENAHRDVTHSSDVHTRDRFYEVSTRTDMDNKVVGVNLFQSYRTIFTRVKMGESEK